MESHKVVDYEVEAILYEDPAQSPKEAGQTLEWRKKHLPYLLDLYD